MQLNFATHGQATLGPLIAWTNWIIQEGIYSLFKFLAYCNKSLSYIDPETGSKVQMDSLPYNPNKDRETINKYLSYY